MFRASGHRDFQSMRLRSVSLAALLAVIAPAAPVLAQTSIAPTAATAPQARRAARRAGRRSGRPRSTFPYEQFTLRQRPARHRPHRSQGADRRGVGLVQCRLEERARGQDRLRASVRASDVRRLGECAGRLLRAAAQRRRDRPERHDLVRPHQLFRDRADRRRSTARCSSKATAWAICSARSTQEKLDRPARRRPEREAPGRQPALRPGRIRPARSAVPRRPPLSPLDDRLDGRSRRRQPGRREATGSATTTARTTPCSCWPATSTRRPPAPLVENYFGDIPRGPVNTPAAADVPTLAAPDRRDDEGPRRRHPPDRAAGPCPAC